MSLNNTEANYSSLWDIDQLYAQGETDGITISPTGLNNNYVTLNSFNLGYSPIVDGVWQVSGDTVWRQFGDSSYSSFWVNAYVLLAVNISGVYLVYTNLNPSATTVNVRWYVWTDKVNY